MGRKVDLVICKVCGGQARKINYVSRSKGKTYHYYKYVHLNKKVHYYRIVTQPAKQISNGPELKKSVFDSLEEIVSLKMRGKDLTFSEIKSLFEVSYGKPISISTLYRNINKMLKLNLIGKRDDGDIVLYGRKSEVSSEHELKTTKMSIGFDFTSDSASVTVFAHVKNLGLRIITGFPISLPVGVINSLEKINLIAFDGTKRIILTNENITYSYTDHTGISITLNRPLRKSDEEDLFINYLYRHENRPIKIIIPLDVDILKVKCEVAQGRNVEMKKRLLDGLKEIDSLISRRTGSEIGRIIVEGEFEKALRGEAIIITLGD